MDPLFTANSAPCKSCDPLIILLKQEINELNDRQNNLKKVNETLTKALGKPEEKNSAKSKLQIDWKEKYEQEIRRTL